MISNVIVIEDKNMPGGYYVSVGATSRPSEENQKKISEFIDKLVNQMKELNNSLQS